VYPVHAFGAVEPLIKKFASHTALPSRFEECSLRVRAIDSFGHISGASSVCATLSFLGISRRMHDDAMTLCMHATAHACCGDAMLPIA